MALEDHEKRLSALEANVTTHQIEIIRLRDSVHNTRDEMQSMNAPLVAQIVKLETQFSDFSQEAKTDFNELKESVNSLGGMSKDFHVMVTIGKVAVAVATAVTIAGLVRYLGLA